MYVLRKFTNGSRADKSLGLGHWSLVKLLTTHQITSYYFTIHSPFIQLQSYVRQSMTQQFLVFYKDHNLASDFKLDSG